MIGAGQLNRRITITRPGAPIDNGLELVPGAPEVVAEVWAKRTDASDGERTRAGADSAKVMARFVIRWRAGIDRTCAIQAGGLHFQIVGHPKEPEGTTRQWLEITAVADA